MVVAGGGRFGVFRLGHQSARGANGGAGAAAVAGEVGRISSTEQGNHRVESPVGKGQEVVAISSTANVNALAAKHTAEWIVGEKSEVYFLVNVPLEEIQRVGLQGYLEVLGDADELAITLDWTVLRVAVVGGHEQFESHALKASHRRSVGPHCQTFADFLCTRGHRSIKAVNLHKAQPA